MAEIHVGDLFPTFLDFEKKLQLYKETKYVDFYISDSRTLESARKRCPKLIEKVPEEVKYYYVKFKCVRGGVHKMSKKHKGMRESSTLKQDCKAFIYLKVDESSCNLIVTKMLDCHDHEVSKALFDHLPKQKRLSPGTKQDVCELLQLKANKKMVQEKVFQTTGKHLTLKDLSNISAKGKNASACNDIESVINKIKTKYNCNVQLMISEKNNFLGLFVQDVRMKTFYSAFPELIFADSTYKLLDIRTPVFVLMAEDSNGQSEVVAIGLLVHEDKQTLKWFFETFKEVNISSANKTVVIMTDKDLTERAVVREIFPDAFMRICLFHALRSFSREVSCEKMGITPSQKDVAREIFQRICYATSLEKYTEECTNLKNVAAKPVWEYFDKNWNNIKEEWSAIPAHNISSYLNSTNNRLESFNSKLKSVCSHFSSLDKFFDNLFVVLSSLRMERDNLSAKMLMKMPTKTLENPEEEIFFHILTPYAFNLVKNQLKESKTLSDEIIITHEITEFTCNCKFMFSMCLPCKHIFFYRRKNSLSLFDENMYNKRWTKEYFLSNLSLLNGASVPTAVIPDDITVIPDTVITTVTQPKERALSTQEKFKKAMMTTNKLASIVAEQSKVNFDDRIDLLENIYRLWSQGKNLAVVEITQQPQIDFNNVTDEEPINENILSATNNDGTGTVNKIIMPTKVQMRGRPKGATLTAIGLKKKNKDSKLISFEKKNYIEKREIMLRWFLSRDVLEKIKNNNYIAEESDVESRPEVITSAIFNNVVDLNLIKCFFSTDGWNMLQSVIEVKKRNYTVVCSACSSKIGAENTINCSLCLLTYHSKCVSIKTPRKKLWFCSTCRDV